MLFLLPSLWASPNVGEVVLVSGDAIVTAGSQMVRSKLSMGWSAKVMAIQGEQLLVQPVLEGCGGHLMELSAPLEVQVQVEKAAVQPCTIPAEPLPAARQLPPIPTLFFPGGTPLYWPDGTPAGISREPLALDHSETRGLLRCTSLASASLWGSLSICGESTAVQSMENSFHNALDQPISSGGSSTTIGGGLIGQTMIQDSAGHPVAVGPSASAESIGVEVGADPIILGALDKSLIDAVLKKHRSDLLQCYRTYMHGETVSLTIKFVILNDGRVGAASVKRTNLPHTAFEQCLNHGLMDLRFPEPKGGGIVITSYPFYFRS